MAGRRRARSITICFSCFIFIADVLYRQQSAPSIAVAGSVPTPLTLTAESLAQMPCETATVSGGGIDTQSEGVWLPEILKKGGLPGGEGLTGKMLTTYVLAEAQDGYQVVFSLGELD